METIPAISLGTDELRHLALECHELAARHHLTPFAQGKLDCLCGLYSVINAIRLLREPIDPVSHTTSRRLFEAGTASLLRRGLLDAALVDGIVIRHWKQLATLLTRQASTNSLAMSVELPIKFNRKLTAVVIERWLVDSLAEGKPVLLHLGRKHQHYTLVAGIDSQNITLFDSWGLVRIKRAGFVQRHDITASCLMRLSLNSRI
jgi:hypothetical protein